MQRINTTLGERFLMCVVCEYLWQAAFEARLYESQLTAPVVAVLQILMILYTLFYLAILSAELNDKGWRRFFVPEPNGGRGGLVTGGFLAFAAMWLAGHKGDRVFYNIYFVTWVLFGLLKMVGVYLYTHVREQSLELQRERLKEALHRLEID